MSDLPAAQKSAQWAQPGFGSRRQLGFFYWIMRVGGVARGYHMANIAAAWYVLFSPTIRRRCGFYLRRRFPQHTGWFARLVDTYRLARSYAQTLVDIKVQAMFGPDTFSVASPTRERLSAVAARPGGLIVVHAHVGCWQIGMATLRILNRDVCVVMAPDGHTQAMLDQNHLKLIDPRTGLDSSVRMTQTLLAGNILALAGDRTFGQDKGTVMVDFLGCPARLPITPFRMASATGAPVVILTAPRIGKRSYEIRLAKLIEVPPGLGRAAKNYAPYCRQFAECIEEFVGQYPWQFYNFFDLWEARNQLNADIEH